MKFLGILGSSRSNGNTQILLETALENARMLGHQTESVILRDLTIGPCDGCMGCHQTGECVVDDDMQDVYDKIKAADGIIWATPVYYWSMTGLTKMAMDRTYALNFPELQQAGKIGGLILVAASRGCVAASQPFQMYFNYNHMFAAEFAWGMAGAKGDIIKDKFGMTIVGEMVKQMIGLYDAKLVYPATFKHTLLRHTWEKIQE